MFHTAAGDQGESSLLTFSMWPLSTLSSAKRLGSPCPAESPRMLVAGTRGTCQGRARINA